MPKVPGQEAAYQREVVPFLGLNQTDNIQEGELSSCENLSARRYPHLAPRKGRTGEVKSAPTAIFSWDGKLILVDGTTLLYDGEAVGTVVAGEKQFAVVNTKLCIWPDKVFLDLSTKEFGALEASVSLAPGTTAEFTTSSITMTGQYARVSTEYTGMLQSRVCSDGYVTRKYSSVSWSPGSGWVLQGEEEVGIVTLAGTDPCQNNLRVGDIVMLQASDIQGNYQINARGVEGDLEPSPNVWTYLGEYSENNRQGFYGKILSTTLEVVYHEPGLHIVKQNIQFQVLNAANNGLDLTRSFSTGDRVTISGCATIPSNNTGEGKHLEVKGVTANTLTFGEGTFAAGTEGGVFTVHRPLPPLDYICESENRLWGASNQDKTIYVSTLGDPKNFYVFNGLSTDSYAVAVGSEGNFTALCKYGNAVLAWKERTLHKILGSYPAEYQMANYQYSGVRAGSHKSLVNMNEVLYYLGTDGVYVYTGGSPGRISDALGPGALYQGCAGTDGRHYYLSCRGGQGSVQRASPTPLSAPLSRAVQGRASEGEEEGWSLLTYDTANHLWLREDATHAVDFCRVGDRLLFLAGKAVYTMESGAEEVAWSATLAPFYETIQGRKRYSRLFLRAEVPRGSWIRVEVRCGNGRWKEIGRIVGRREDVQVLPITPNRCDRFEVRLTGKGDCALLSLLREFRVASER